MCLKETNRLNIAVGPKRRLEERKRTMSIIVDKNEKKCGGCKKDFWGQNFGFKTNGWIGE